MEQTILKSSILATALACASSFTVTPNFAQAQLVPIPQTASQVPGPAPGTAMTEAYVQTVGRMAYLWGWPLVNVANRRAAFARAPEPGLLGGVIPVAYNRLEMLTGYIAPDQHFIACPNQDVAYGAGFFTLDKEPIVFQVPDFGDRFWVYALYDARTDECSEIGKQYGTKPGFYLLVGPNWTGNPPAGITAVVRSPGTFFDELPAVMKQVPPLPGEEAALYNSAPWRLLPKTRRSKRLSGKPPPRPSAR